MKAEIIIPKGWKLLHFTERIQVGDRMLLGSDLIWDRLDSAWYGLLAKNHCVIRSKAVKPSPKIKKGSAKK